MTIECFYKITTYFPFIKTEKESVLSTLFAKEIKRLPHPDYFNRIPIFAHLKNGHSEQKYHITAASKSF